MRLRSALRRLIKNRFHSGKLWELAEADVGAVDVIPSRGPAHPPSRPQPRQPKKVECPLLLSPRNDKPIGRPL